jgi:hypothetical protein
MAWPTIEDLRAYCGIDYDDEMVERNLIRALDTANLTLKGAIGDDVDTVLPDDHRAHTLVLIYGEDLYSNRGVFNTDNAKVSGATRRMTNDLETQVRMEYRRKQEGAE